MSEDLTHGQLMEMHRDELDKVASDLGIENPQDLSNKEEVADAILEKQRESSASEGASGDGTGSQDDTPGDDDLPVSEDETGADALVPDPVDLFEDTYGHLDGEAREAAEKVFAAQQRHKAEVDAIHKRGFIGDGEYVVEETEEDE